MGDSNSVIPALKGRCPNLLDEPSIFKERFIVIFKYSLISSKIQIIMNFFLEFFYIFKERF